MIKGDVNSHSANIFYQIPLGDGEITGDIIQIGKLKYEFDQTPENVDLKRVQALFSSMDMTISQYGDDETDLFNVLISGTEGGSVNVEFKLTPPGKPFGFYEFPFKLRYQDVTLDEKNATIKLKFTPRLKETLTYNDVFDAVGTNVTYVRNGRDWQAMGVGGWIEKALNKVLDNDFDFFFAPSLSLLDVNTYDGQLYTPGMPTQRGFCLIRTDASLYDSGEDQLTFIPASSTINMDDLAACSFADSADFDNIDVGDIIETIVQFGFQTGGPPFRFRSVTLDVVSKNAGNSTVELSPNFALSFSAGVIGSFTYSEGDNSSNTFKIVKPTRPDIKPAIDILKDLAGIEGSVFGTGFSKNFYFYRTSLGGDALQTLNFDEVIDIKPTPTYLPLGASVIGQIANFDRQGADNFGTWPIDGGDDSGVPNLAEYYAATEGNPNATQGLQINIAPAYPMLNKVQTTLTPPSTLTFSGDDLTGDNNLERALTSNGLTSYFQSLNTESGNLRVQMTIREAFSILPWHTFQFDSRADARYRDRQFRPTSLAYDFAKDEVEVTAYQITNDTTPVYTASPYGRQWHKIPFNSYTPPEFVVYRNGKAVSDVFSKEGKIKSAVEVQPGGADGTLSDYAKRVDQTVSASGLIKSSVEVEPGGSDGTLSKKLSPITADGRISKDAEIEVGGASGTLSKRLKGLDDDGDIGANMGIKSTGKITGGTNYELDEDGLHLASLVGATENASVQWSEGLSGDYDFRIAGERLDPKRGGVIEYINTFFIRSFSGTSIFEFGINRITSFVRAIFEDSVEIQGNTIQPYITIPEISGTNDNLDIGDGTRFRISGTNITPNTVTGIAGGNINGRVIYITNTGDSNISFENENTGSTASNRIRSSDGNISVGQDETITLCYDSSVSRWRVQQLL